MTCKLGIAVIGLGPASLPHSKSLLDLAGRAEVRWAVSRTPDRAAAYAAQFPFPTTTDLDAVLADPTVDAAIVLTPPSSHLDVSALCLEAGKHVLVEKPLELTSERGQRLVDTARRTGRTFGVTLQHRFRPASLRLKAALESDELGSIEASHHATSFSLTRSTGNRPISLARIAAPVPSVGTNMRSFHEMISWKRPKADRRSRIVSVKPDSSIRWAPMTRTRRS